MSDPVLESRLRAWSYLRQGLDRREISASDCLERSIAVYSSSPSAPLTLLARSGSMTAEEFSSLEAERLAIRLPAMRGSVFLIPVSTAPDLLSATLVSMKTLQSRLDYGSVSGEEYERIKHAFLEVATLPMTTEELQEAIPTSAKLMVAVRVLAYEGLALRINPALRGDRLRYVSTSAWLGQEIETGEPDASLQWLAGEYLRAFGPVRVTDFAWWAGVTKTRARKAFEGLRFADLGDGLLIAETDLDGWERTEPLSGDEVAILPKWDAYTMGYPSESRSRFVRREHQELAYPKIRATRGDGAPLILRGGLAVASWSHRFQGDQMIVSVSPFDSGEKLTWISEHNFEPAGVMLGATDLEVLVESTGS